MEKANAAQVFSGFIWKNDMPKKIMTGSIEKGFTVDQTVLLEYLMKFQTWLNEAQPHLIESKKMYHEESNSNN